MTKIWTPYNTKIDTYHSTYTDATKEDRLTVYWEEMYRLSGQKEGYLRARAEAIKAAAGMISAASNAKGLLRDSRNETVPAQIEAALAVWNKWVENT